MKLYKLVFDQVIDMPGYYGGIEKCVSELFYIAPNKEIAEKYGESLNRGKKGICDESSYIFREALLIDLENIVKLINRKSKPQIFNF